MVVVRLELEVSDRPHGRCRVVVRKKWVGLDSGTGRLRLCGLLPSPLPGLDQLLGLSDQRVPHQPPPHEEPLLAGHGAHPSLGADQEAGLVLLEYVMYSSYVCIVGPTLCCKARPNEREGSATSCFRLMNRPFFKELIAEYFVCQSFISCSKQ